MNPELAVIGKGAVSPAGIGIEALLGCAPKASPTAEIRRPEKTWPVFRVDQKSPELLHWQKEPRLRRASPLTLFLIEAASQALGDATATERARTGLIIALSAGCLVYSRRFFEGIIAEGQKRASPMLFPETVFNSPGSHVAAALQLNGAAYALVGDEVCWIAALKTAEVWLRKRRVGQVLVLGGEEFDPAVLDAYRSARWLRPGTSLVPSEGAAAVLVRLAKPADEQRIPELHDGYIYRNSVEVAAAAKKLFSRLDPVLPCFPTAQRNRLRSLEEKMISKNVLIHGEKFPYLGEAFTASAGWNTLRALSRLSQTMPALTVPVWGLNHQLGAVELRRSLQ